MRKIKIVFLHWCLVCGGAETALYDLINLLDKNIFDITIFSIYGGGEWEEKFLATGVKILNSYSGINQSGSLCGKIYNFVRAKLVKYALSHGGRGLLKVCTPNDYDIIVSFHVGDAFQYAGFSGNAKTIQYIHGDVATNADLMNTLVRNKELQKQYDKIICVSEHAKQSYLRYIGSNDRICMCYNPIDSKRIMELSMEKPEKRIEGQYICAVGRLTKAKGYVRLVQIFKQLIDNGINTQLLIVGEGPERPNIENAIQKCGLHNKVILVGHTNNPYPYIRNTQFTVCSSYTEGLHLVSMESLSLGVPVVSIFPTVAEIIGNEPCGIVVDNERDFYQAMERLLNDKVYYEKIKSAAIKRSHDFSGNVMIKKVEQEYISLLDNPTI